MAYSQAHPADHGLHNCTSNSSVTRERGKAPSLTAAVTAELDFCEQFCCQGRKQESGSTHKKAVLPTAVSLFSPGPQMDRSQQRISVAAPAEHSWQPDNYELSAPSLRLWQRQLPRRTTLAFLLPVILDSGDEGTLETTQPFPSDMWQTCSRSSFPMLPRYSCSKGFS